MNERLNEKLNKLRDQLNDFQMRKFAYVKQREQADEMIDEFNFRIDDVQDQIDELNKKVEMVVRGEEVTV